MKESGDKMRVDIVSDVVCPWCVIGYHQLAAAARAEKVELQIYWQPFELNRQMPQEGENLREHLAAKYGTTPEGSRKAREKLTAIGGELGFRFAYTDDMRMRNTFRAHQLIAWAEGEGLGHATKLALFAAFFTEQRDVADIDELVQVAGAVGLDSTGARRVLESGECANRVREREQEWLERGIHGVPAMIFDGRFMATGAQGVDAYRALLQRARAEQAA